MYGGPITLIPLAGLAFYCTVRNVLYNVPIVLDCHGCHWARSVLTPENTKVP